MTLGAAFVLSSSLTSKINRFEPLQAQGNMPLAPPLQGRTKAYNGGYYIGEDPVNPQVGDMRVKFMQVKPQQVSVIANQSGNTFEPYRAEADASIELLQTGIHAPGAKTCSINK